MSTDFLPREPWQSGTNENSIPANNNSLRTEATERPCLGVANDEAGGDAEGDVWIVGSAPTGAFATFDEDDVAIFDGAGWHAWAPFEGMRLVVNDVRKVYETGAWVNDPSITGGSSSRSAVSALATSGALTVDYALGDYFTCGLTGNVTSGWTFNNMPGAGNGATLGFLFTQDTTPRTVAFPASFNWGAGNSAPTMPTGSGAKMMVIATTWDNGTTWNATSRVLA